MESKPQNPEFRIDPVISQSSLEVIESNKMYVLK